jgi:hypothetical protein
MGVPIWLASFEAIASRLLVLTGITLPIVPTGTTWLRQCLRRKLDLLQAAAGIGPSLPQRNSVPSAHIRCRMATC